MTTKIRSKRETRSVQGRKTFVIAVYTQLI